MGDLLVSNVEFKKGLEANLPTEAGDGIVLVTEDSGRMYLGKGLGNPLLPLGADPNLGARVGDLEESTEQLEAAQTTATRTFTEDFKTQNKVDLVKTDATVGTGYVRTEKLATFSEDYATTDNLDTANSRNVVIDTAAKKLTLTNNNIEGQAVSVLLPTQGTTHATLDAVVNHKSATAFSQYDKLSTMYLTQDQTVPGVAIDRANRTWYAWLVAGTATTGGLYVRVINPDKSVAYQGMLASFAYVVGGGGVEEVRLAVDYDNKVWISIAYHKTTASSFVGYYGFNPDFTIFKPYTETYTSTVNIAVYTDIFVDRNNKIWIVYGSQSGSYTYTILHADGTIMVPGTVSFAGNQQIYKMRWVYDETRDRMVVIFSGATTAASLRSAAYNMSGALVLGGVTAVNTTSTNLLSIAPVYELSMDKILVFAQHNTTKQVTLYTINPATLTLLTTVSVAGTSLTTDHSISVVRRETDYLVAYTTTVDNANSTVHVIGVKADGTVTVPDMNVNVNEYASAHNTPYMYKDVDGNIRVMYSSKKYGVYWNIEEATYLNTSSTASYELSSDNGLTWVPATLGEQVAFQTLGDGIKVRINLTAPLAGYSPEVLSFSITEGNEAAGAELVRTFYSSMLPSVSPVAKATIAAEMDLSSGGSVDWFLTNDGGANWYPVSIGQLFSFPNMIGGDLRVKAVLTCPITATASPKITRYTVSSNSVVATVSDTNTFMLNLMHSNFRFDAYTKASRSVVHSLVTDYFNNQLGTDTDKTTASFDPIKNIYHVKKEYARGKTATASSTSGGWDASHVTDGSTANAAANIWSSTAATDGTIQWVYIDLGVNPQPYEEVSIHWRSGGSTPVSVPWDWKIEVSDNTTNWTPVFTATDFPVPEITRSDLVIGPQTARYVRISATKFRTDGTSTKWFQIAEVQVFGGDISFSGVVVAQPVTTPTIPRKLILGTMMDLGSSGTIMFEASRDGGVTWMDIAADSSNDLGALAPGTQLIVKATLTGDATLKAWSYSWL